MSSSERMTVYFSGIDETQKCLIVSDDGGKTKIFLPKSQISVTKIKGPQVDALAIEMPVWLAKQKGVL